MRLAKLRLGSLLAVLVTAVAVSGGMLSAGSPSPASAAGPVTRTWTGAGPNNSWTTNANWNPAAPNAGDILVFPAAAARKANSNNYPNFTSFSELRFEGGGYTISGNRADFSVAIKNNAPGGTNTISMILDGDATLTNMAGTLNLLAANSHKGPNFIDSGIVHAGHSNAFGEFDATVDFVEGLVTLADGLSIFNPLIIGGPTAPELLAKGDVEWLGTVALAGHSEFDVDLGFQFAIRGEISGHFDVVKAGPGELLLTAENTYSGLTEVRAGTLRITRREALGLTQVGTIVENGGTLHVDGTSLPEEHIKLNGAGMNGAGALRSSAGIINLGSVSVASDAAIRVDGVRLRLEGGLEQEGPGIEVTKTGAGELEFMGAGGFDGTVNVIAGELAVRTALLADVEMAGGLLTGEGSIGALHVTAGTVEPGFDGGGTLDVDGPLFLGPGSTARFGFESVADHASLRVTGNVTLAGGALEVNGAGVVAPGVNVALIENASANPINGIFNNLLSGEILVVGGNDFRVSYVGGSGPANDFILTALEGLAPTDTGLVIAPLPESWPAGSELAVTYLAFNRSPDDALGAEIRMPVLAGAVFAGYSAPEGWACVTPNVGQAGTVICQRAIWLPTGAVIPDEFVVRMRLTGAPGSSFFVDALLLHAGVEFDDADNVAVRSIAVGSADARPFKLGLPGVARDGSN